MKKTFNLGKIDYLNNGKKNCPVEIDLDFDDKRLSICGTVWNHIKSDCYTAGQCLDDLKEYENNTTIYINNHRVYIDAFYGVLCSSICSSGIVCLVCN